MTTYYENIQVQAVERQAANNLPMRQLLSTLSTEDNFLSDMNINERATGATEIKTSDNC